MQRWLVVGGGAAGCVVAGRLSEDPTNHVVLLEAGPDHDSLPPDVDRGPALEDPARIAVEHVQRRAGGAPTPYRRGHGLGGSSLINGAVVTAPELAPPELPLESPVVHGAVATALLAADGRARPVALVREGGVRRTAADLFVRPHAGRPNLEVWCDSAVRRLRFHGRRVIGVEMEHGGSVDADRVVVCAGAIRTPTLLLRSGVDTPGVGEGVRDHPAFTLTLRLFDWACDAAAPMISAAATHDAHQVVALDCLPDDPHYGALMVGLLRSGAEGRISLQPDGEPAVELRQLDLAEDREALVEAVATTVRRLDDPAWHSVVAATYVDDQGTRLEQVVHDHLDRWVVDHVDGHHHISSSCREGVVTDGGAVRGYDGLYVADASALRDVPSIDPYVAVIRQADALASGW